MKSILQELDRESILLLYLADELQPQDRLELEQMLAVDKALRAEADALRQAQQSVELSLAELDRQTRPVAPQAVIERRIGRLLRQHVLQRMAAKAAPAAAPRPNLWTRVAFTSAAAAALLLGYLIWGVYHPAVSLRSPLPSVFNHSQPELTNEEKLALLTNTMDLTGADTPSDTDDKIIAAVPRSGDAYFGDDAQ